MNWSLLDASHPIISDVAVNWQKLLDENHQERIYHDFLRRHANLFLANGTSSFFAISKLKLGSEYELDFAIPHEEYSRGLFWELIEIKTPQVPPYTDSGVPSAKLIEATQQVRNWKRWIQASRAEAMKLFSLWSVRCERRPNFRFTIIIGTRENSKKWLTERNQYAEENNVSIRSFDYLMDKLKARIFRDSVYLGSGNWDASNPDLCSQLANPFIEALTDSQWKKLLREPDVGSPHFVSRSCKALLSHWTPNRTLMDRFRESVAD